MNVYEAMKLYDKTLSKRKLSNAAQALFWQIATILNKNFWKPTKIMTRELLFNRGQLTKIREELILSKLIIFEKGFYKISDTIVAEDDTIVAKNDTIVSNDPAPSLEKSKSAGLLNNKQINNINIYNKHSINNKQNKEEVKDEHRVKQGEGRTTPNQGHNSGESEDNGGNEGKLGRVRYEKLPPEGLEKVEEIPYIDQLREWGRKRGYNFED